MQQSHSDRKENMGNETDHILSPKLSMVLGPWKNVEYYLNYAYGFHSNDARGTTTRLNIDPRDSNYLNKIDSVSPLVRTINSEIGLRANFIPELTSTIALWQLDSDSELVFLGDAGTTEASRPSKRQGIEISQFYQPTDAWIIDLDAAWSKARLSYHTNSAEARILASVCQSKRTDFVCQSKCTHWPLKKCIYFGK